MKHSEKSMLLIFGILVLFIAVSAVAFTSPQTLQKDDSSSVAGYLQAINEVSCLKGVKALRDLKKIQLTTVEVDQLAKFCQDVIK